MPFIAARRDVLTSIAFGLVACALLAPLLSQPMWRDEGTTYLSISQHGIAAVLEHVRLGELTPPLYFVLEYLWAQRAGMSEVALRLPSLLAMSVTVGLLYDTSRRLGGRIAGYVTATCACIAPLSLFAGSDVRPYALTLLFAAITLHAVALLLLDEHVRPEHAGIALAIAVAALCWTHYTAWVAVAGLLLAAPIVWLGSTRDRSLAYTVSIAAGAATSAPLLRAFTSVTRSTPHALPGSAAANLFQQIDQRLIWFNPTVIAEPLFVILLVGGTGAWALSRMTSSPATRFSPQNQLLAACAGVALCGIGASVAFRVPPHLHLAAYAPAVWLLTGSYYARLASLLRGGDGAPRWRSAKRWGLWCLTAITIFAVCTFPLTYAYERAPRSGSRALTAELRRLVPRDAALVAVPDALSPSLKYDLRTDRSIKLQGLPTWSRPWYNGAITTIDRARESDLTARIDHALQRCTRVAFAVDWNWKTQTDAFHIPTGTSYEAARRIVRREATLRGVAFHRAFPGTFETLDLLLLAPTCARDTARIERPLPRLSSHARARITKIGVGRQPQ